VCTESHANVAEIILDKPVETTSTVQGIQTKSENGTSGEVHSLRLSTISVITAVQNQQNAQINFLSSTSHKICDITDVYMHTNYPSI
jgi:hypothetical protein